jgi:hypothetical protein
MAISTLFILKIWRIFGIISQENALQKSEILSFIFLISKWQNFSTSKALHLIPTQFLILLMGSWNITQNS